MLISSPLSLILSAAIAFATRFHSHGDASGETAPLISERDLTAPSIVCGVAGTDKEKPAAYTGPHATSIQDCLAKCRGSNGCQSVAFDASHSVCLLYKAPVAGNINYDTSQAYQFYDLSCPQGGSSGIASVVTLTVTGAAPIVTSTVVVVLPPEPTTLSRASGFTSTLVVYYTVTQGAPIASATVPNTIFATLPLTTVLLTNAPTPAPASTFSTKTTYISANPSPPPGGLLCGVNGWSASTTSFFDNSGDLGSQDACELACRTVSCGSYGFNNNTCLAYAGSVSQSAVLSPASDFQFFDAGCVVSHK